MSANKMTAVIVAVTSLLFLGYFLFREPDVPGPTFHAINYTWEVEKIDWTKDGEKYQISAILRAERGRGRIQMDNNAMRHICGGLLTLLPEKPIASITRTDVSEVTFNILEPGTDENFFPYNAVVSIADGQCGSDGYFDTPYVDIAKIGKLDDKSYADLLESLSGWVFQDIHVERKNGETIVEAVFAAGSNEVDSDNFPYIVACNVVLQNLPIQVQIQGVEYDFSDLSKISIKHQNKMGISIANISTSSSYVLDIRNGLCIDPAAPG